MLSTFRKSTSATVKHAPTVGIPDEDNMNIPDLTKQAPSTIPNFPNKGSVENHILELIRDQGDYKVFVLFDSNPEIDLFNALCVACYHGTLRMVNFLIEKGAKMNESRPGTFSPLHIASSRVNGGDFVRTLIEHGADINLVCDIAADSKGWTALHIASLNGNRTSAQLLIQKLANLNAFVDFNFIGQGKCTPLALACTSNKEIVQDLLKAGADINGGKDGVPPIHVAVSNKNVEILEILLKNGANVNAQCVSQVTALHLAVKMENIEQVQYMLNFQGASKINVELKDLRGNTALHVAALIGNTKIISMLICAGANPFAINGDSKTPDQLANPQIATFIEQEARIAASLAELRIVQHKLAQQEKTITELKGLVLSLLKDKIQELPKISKTEEVVQTAKKETADYSNFYPDWHKDQ